MLKVILAWMVAQLSDISKIDNEVKKACDEHKAWQAKDDYLVGQLASICTADVQY